MSDMKAIPIAVALALLVLTHLPQRKVVDCSLASFHPDYTNDMRKQCRSKTHEH